MKQIIAFLVFWISFLSCQSEEINIYTQHVKEISKNKDGWNLVWSEEFEQESNLSLIHISEPTRRTPISYAVFCLKKKKSK